MLYMHRSCLKSYTRAFFYLVICSFISPCRGLAIERAIFITKSTSHNDTQTHCGFAGTSDVLGIGIRIGYYTQALSVWFANYFVHSEAKVLRSINLLFLVALFIGLVWLAHAPQESFAVEVYLLLRLLFATWYVGVLDRSKFSKKHWRKSYGRVIVRESSLLGLLAYTVWFAWVGLDRLKETPCGTFIFFIVKINLYGVYRSVFKGFTVSALCCGVIKQIDTAIQLSRQWRRTAIVNDPNYFSRLYVALKDQGSQKVKTPEIETPQTGNIPVQPVETKNIEQQDDSSSLNDASIPPTLDVWTQETQMQALELAIQTPLPQSPSPSGSRLSSVAEQIPASKSLPSDHTNRDLPSLEDLMQAEDYLKSIIEIDVRNHSRWCYEIKWIPLKFFLPSIHSPKTLYKRLSSLYACRPFRLPILLLLFRHIKSLCRFPLYSYGFMLEAALHSPHHHQLSSTTLATALALHKAQLPSHRPRPHTIVHAAAAMIMCVFLILSVELSIRWNKITGMGNAGAVGQLIPAIIGIGGLLRVVWVWWLKGEVEEVEDDGVGREVRECAELYQRLRKERERKSRTEVVGV